MERLLIIFLVLVALNLSAIFIILQGRTSETPVAIPTLALLVGETPLTVTLADSSEERTLGLSGRTALPQGEGLLFIFPETGNWGFWMKDMHFPIDILWLGDDFVIHTIEESVPPESYPTIFYPSAASRYVIEAEAGFAEKHGIGVGEKVVLDARD